MSLTPSHVDIMILLRRAQPLQTLSAMIHVNEDALDDLINRNLVAIASNDLTLTDAGHNMLKRACDAANFALQQEIAPSPIPVVIPTRPVAHKVELRLVEPTVPPADFSPTIRPAMTVDWRRMSKEQRRKLVIG